MPKKTGKLADALFGVPDQAAFGVYPQMKPRRSQQDPEAAKNFPIDVARGFVSGAAGQLGDIESIIRMLPGLDEKTILPTSEDIEKRIPFKSDTPVSRAATGLGQLAGGFYTGPGSPLRLAAGLPGAMVKAGQDFAMAAGASGPRIFIGPKAKTWDQAKADAAARMEKEGVDPGLIWQQTGTFRGADGIWRQEIDDRAAKFLSTDERKERLEATKSKIAEMKEKIKPTPQKDLFPKALTEAKKEIREDIDILKGDVKNRERNPRTQGLLAQYIFEHPELYKAYPELQNVKFVTEGGNDGTLGALSIVPSRGNYPGSMAIDIYDKGLRNDPTSTSLHEMQHAVQTLEGMGPGGNPTFAFSDPRAYEMLQQERLKMLKALPYEDFVRQGGYTDMEQAGKDYVKYTKGLEGGIDPAYDRMLQERVAMEYYKRLLGEAEARAAQDRRLMTPAQRMETPPPASYDVPQEDLIVKPPREYADGGAVKFTDNLDAMRLELAGGGAVKMDNGGAAFGVFPQAKPRRSGRSNVDANVAIPRGLARGFVSGAAGVGGDLESIARMLANTPGPKIFGETTAAMLPGQYKTGDVGMKTRLPTSEDVEKVVPFRPENPSAMEQVATGAGQIAGGFYTGPGAPIRAVTAIPEAVGKAARDFALAAGQPAVNVVKSSKGGNWLDDRLKRELEHLRTRGVNNTDPAEQLARLEEKYGKAGAEEVLASGMYPMIKEYAALNNWIDRNLTNYVKKQMGTPEDPVRLLAEQNITHLPADVVHWGANQDIPVAKERVAAGFPAEGMGQSTTAKAWENISDESIYPYTAGRIQQVMRDVPEVQAAERALKDRQLDVARRFDEKIRAQGNLSEEQIEALNQKTPIRDKEMILGESKLSELMDDYDQKRRKISAAEYNIGRNNPWIEKLDPSERIYTAGVDGLGFDHIIDVLRQDVASGRIRPEQLNKVSMEQAVRRTAEYDAELAAKMNAERAAAREGLPVYKEYPEGYRWIELNKPGAFSAESEAMGHSVRGYEPPAGHPDWSPSSGDSGSLGYGHGGWEAIKSGQAKVYSLVDPKGQPHVTVEVKAKPTYTADDVIQQFPGGVTDAMKAGDVGGQNYIAKKLAEMNSAGADRITQIKGKQNQAPNPEYLPFVQDFVRSGQWSDVGDIRNTGLSKIGGKYMNAEEVNALRDEAANFLTSHPAFEPYRRAQAQYDEFKGDVWGPEFDQIDKTAAKQVHPDVPYTYRELLDVLKNPESYAGRNELAQDVLGHHLGLIDKLRGIYGEVPKVEKKTGGPVHFTDNPDAMRLELAGGGLVKGLKAAVKGAKTEAQAAKEAPTIIIPSKVSRVEEAVRQSKGDYGAKRVQRAADEVPNLERMFQEQALRQAFMGDNAKAMATIKPQDFEKFAEPLERSTDFRWGYAKDLPDMTQQEYLDYLMKIEGGFSDVPYLELNKARAGEPGTVWVSGHEGRHRNRALANRGENASIVQILPRAELREPLPRRSQEEYIEALRKELGPKVRPQQNLTGEGPRDRPPIDMPDIYAKGGAVEMQAGGLARFFGSGAKAAKSAEKIPAVPLDIPRVRPTKQEIFEAAERVGKQQAGEHVTSPLLGKTENLAGRSKREAQRVKELKYEVKPIKELPPVEVYQPKVGEVNIALPGDQTIADAMLMSVDDIPVGSVQEGGALFGRGRLQDPEETRAFWASNVGPAQIFQNKVSDLAKKYDTDLVTAYHLAMGTDANNFAQHFADANLRAVDYSKLSKRDMDIFDRAIADGYVKKNQKTGEYVHTSFPEWPGIANPEASYQAMKENPELRKWFNNRMKTEKLTRATNMPDGRSIEWAITEPAIRNMEINMTGLSAGRMKPGAELIPDSLHQTYSHDIPGTALGRAEELAPFSISYPDVTSFVRQKYRPQDFTGTIQKVFPHQVVDEPYLEDLATYYRQLRNVRGFAEGGAVGAAPDNQEVPQKVQFSDNPDAMRVELMQRK